MTSGGKVWRVALIGISGYGRIHLQLARECRARGEVAIVAATVINVEEEAENVAELRAHGCAIYADYTEMLREQRGQIDLCLIPTGIHWHARMTIAALRAGANVLVEKPLAGSLAEIEAVRTAERETGRFVAVGFQDLYEPGTTWLKRELMNGAIGAVESVRFLGIWPRPRRYFERNEWAGRVKVDGVPVFDSPLNNAFGHFVLLSLYFASPTAEAASAVVKQAELFRAHRIESFDTAVVTSETANGVKLWFGVSHASRETEEPEIVIHGEKGTAGWRYEREAWWRDLNGGGDRRRLPDMTATRRSMMAAVLARMSDPAAPICGSEMASRHTAIIEAVHRSGAVREFSAKELNWVEDARQGSEVPEVTGLTIALKKAFEAQQLLTQSGFGRPGAGVEQTRHV
jgi:Predicted dehydrogenases and related proteins